MAKRSTTKPVADSKPDAIKSNVIDFAVLQADVWSALDTMKDNTTHNVKLNQRIAWDILRYRETLSKPVAWDRLKADGAALTSWRKVIRELFIGKAPPMKGDKTQDMHVASKAYKARGRILDDAATFCVAAGLRGVTAEHYSETLGLFVVPPIMLLGHGCSPLFELTEIVDNGGTVNLDNQTWMVSTLDKDGKRATRDIRASLAQCLTVFNEKPKATPQTAAQTKASEAVKGRSEVGTIAEPVIKAVLKNAGIEKLAFAMRDAMNADPNLVIRRTDFEQDVWAALMSIAQRIMSIDSVGDMLANRAA